MAYMNAEEVSSVRKALKASFPKAKFAVRKTGSGVDVSVLKHNIDFSDKLVRDGYTPVNHYWIDDHFNKEQAKFLTEVKNIILTAPATVGCPYYDNSDIMTDYFDVAYYYSIEVGKWNKPYELSN